MICYQPKIIKPLELCVIQNHKQHLLLNNGQINSLFALNLVMNVSVTVFDFENL